MKFKFLKFNNFQVIREIITPLIPLNFFSESSSSVNYPDIKLHLVPELDIEMNRLGLKQFWISSAVIVVKPTGALPIHVDTGKYIWSLNIPIYNTENTFTAYYNTTTSPTFMPKNSGSSSYMKFFPENCVETERFELLGPTLMRTDIPHTVINNNSNVRIAIGLRLDSSFDPKILY